MGPKPETVTNLCRDLQQTVGNRATGALLRSHEQVGPVVLQRKSQAADLAASEGDALTKSLVAMSDTDLIDTLFDPAFAKRHPLAAVVASLRAQGPSGAKGVAAARAAAGPYDEDFYYSLGLLDGGYRTQLWNRLAKDKPKVANPTARTGRTKIEYSDRQVAESVSCGEAESA